MCNWRGRAQSLGSTENIRIKLGFEPRTFWIPARHSYHWATWSLWQRSASIDVIYPKGWVLITAMTWLFRWWDLSYTCCEQLMHNLGPKPNKRSLLPLSPDRGFFLNYKVVHYQPGRGGCVIGGVEPSHWDQLKKIRIKLGFEPRTFWIPARHSYHWATWSMWQRSASIDVIYPKGWVLITAMTWLFRWWDLSYTCCEQLMHNLGPKPHQEVLITPEPG